MNKFELIEKAIYLILAILIFIFKVPLENMLPVEDEEEKVALVIKTVISKLSKDISKSELLKHIFESKSLNFILKLKLLKYILKLPFF
jgi:hypothetical protein